ncbi:hypothetical protein GGX14DRAFT_323982, partial [Mycena pura]
PALLPLPRTSDIDLANAQTLMHGRQKVDKVGGRQHKSRRTSKGKGKKRATSSDPEPGSDGERPAKRGRQPGSSNYSSKDVTALLDLVEEHLPLGGKRWKTIGKEFNKWARSASRPERQEKALENKYKSLLKTKKPTGDAERPPTVKRALEIENLILERAGARNLSDDSEFDEEDFSSSSSSSDEDDDTNKRPKARTAIARRAPSPQLPPRKPRASTTNLMQTIASAFDPNKQQRRDEARAQRNFESTQLLALTQQVETLRSVNAELQNRIHTLERQLDRAELKLELGFGGSQRTRSRSRRHPRHRSDPDRDVSGLQRVGGKVRAEQIYPDGGAVTYWVTDTSDSEA